MSHEGRNILTACVESMNLGPSVSDLPPDRLDTYEIANNYPVIFYWLLYGSRISDDGIIAGIRLVQQIHDLNACQDDREEIWGIEKETNNPEYMGLLQSVIVAIQKDVEENEGKIFRSIIQTYNDYVINSVFGNENIWNWLEEKGKMTVYDFEVAVVAAVMLDMTCVYYRVIQTKQGKN